MTRKIFFIILIISSLIQLAFAEKVKVDSVYKEENEVLQSLEAKLKEALDYYHNDSLEKVYEHLAIINKTIGEDEKAISGHFLAQLADFYETLSDFDKSLELYQQAADQSIAQGDNTNYVNSLNRLGYISSLTGEYEVALESILKALRYVEANNLNDLKESVYIHAAFIYRNYQDFNQAKYYFNLALSIGDSTDREGLYHVSLHELGNLFLTVSDFKKALEFQTRALKIRESMNLDHYLEFSFNDIALTYSFMGDYKKGIEYTKKSISLCKQKKAQWSLAVSYLSISEMYLKVNNSELALTYLDSSEKICVKYGLKNHLSQVHMMYYFIYLSIENYKMALDHFIVSQAYKDSTFGEDTQKQIRLLNAKFESEKKDKEILKNQLTIKRQSILIGGFVAGVLVIFGFLWWLLFWYKKLKVYNLRLNEKNSLIEMQNEEILQKKEEVEVKAAKLKEMNEFLVESNQKITLQKEEIESQRDEIESQRNILLTQKQKLSEINIHLTESIHYAESIQRTMLPSHEQFRKSFKDFFILFEPLDIVSGDFYWLYREKGLVFFAVADCTGHGVSGAFMSLLGISFLNEIIRIKGIKKANLILDELRSNIIDSLKQDLRSGTRKDGMDIALCVFETDTKVLHYSGANNPCWIIRENGEFVELMPDKNPISIYFKMDSFSAQTVQLNPNDCVYLLSDGYYDQIGGNFSKKFQKNKLKELLVNNYREPMLQQFGILYKTFSQWMGSNSQIDDITIIGVRI